MHNQTKFFIIFGILIFVIIIIVIVASYSSKKKDTMYNFVNTLKSTQNNSNESDDDYTNITRENVAETEQNLTKLKAELDQLYANELKYDYMDIYNRVIGNMNIHDIMLCVEKNLIKLNIPCETFDMSGETMDEPILKMCANNQYEMYKVLHHCQFLNLVGRLLGMVYWISRSKNKSKKSLEKYANCLINVNFGNIDVWQYMSNIEKIFGKCM